MVYILSMVTLVFFAIIGISTFISSVKGIGHRAGPDASLVIKGLTAQNAEARIRAAVSICLRYRGTELLAECEDVEAKEICEKLTEGYPFVNIVMKQNDKHKE